MHIDLEYGCQTIDDCFILTEDPTADGYLDKKGHWNNKPKRRVYIYENEGNIPHCHIVGLGPNGNKEVCVKLDKPEYFCHDGKQSKFDSNEKEMFIDFMNSIDSFGVNRWTWCASTWNGFS